MKKLMISALSLLLVLSLAACGGGAAPSATDDSSETVPAANSGDTIKIGVILPMTGDPTVGAIMTNTMQLVVADINSTGGVLGQDLEVVIEDGGRDADTTLNAANKLIARGDLAALGGFTQSTGCMACIEVVEESGIPTMFGGTSVLLNNLQAKNVKRCRVADSYIVRIGMAYLMEEYDIGEGSVVSCLYNADDYGTGGFNVLQEVCQEYNITLQSEQMEADDTDVTAQVLKLNSYNPDALVLWTNNTGMPIAARTIFEQGVSCPVFAAGAATQATVRETSLEYMEGWYTATDVIVDSEDPDIAGFVTKFKEAFPSSDVSYDIFTAYSEIQFLAQVMEKAGSTDPDAMIAAMNDSAGYDTVVGTFQAFGNIEMISTAAVGRYIEGALTEMGQYDGRAI